MKKKRIISKLIAILIIVNTLLVGCGEINAVTESQMETNTTKLEEEVSQKETEINSETEIEDEEDSEIDYGAGIKRMEEVVFMNRPMGYFQIVDFPLLGTASLYKYEFNQEEFENMLCAFYLRLDYKDSGEEDIPGYPIQLENESEEAYDIRKKQFREEYAQSLVQQAGFLLLESNMNDETYACEYVGTMEQYYNFFAHIWDEAEQWMSIEVHLTRPDYTEKLSEIGIENADPWDRELYGRAAQEVLGLENQLSFIVEVESQAETAIKKILAEKKNYEEILSEIQAMSLDVVTSSDTDALYIECFLTAEGEERVIAFPEQKQIYYEVYKDDVLSYTAIICNNEQLVVLTEVQIDEFKTLK